MSKILKRNERAQMHQLAYAANVLEHPNMKSSAVRQLSDPQTRQKVVADVGITNAQSRMFA